MSDDKEGAEMPTLSIQGLRGSGIYGQADEAPKTPAPASTPQRKFEGPPATQKQADFIRVLLAEREGNPEAEGIRGALNILRTEGRLTKARASMFIESLKGLPRSAKAPAQPAQGSGKRPGDPNAYGGKCEHCGRYIEANEGILGKSDSGSWVVSHNGACPSDFPFPEGRYAVEIDGEVKFYSASDGTIYALASDSEYPLRNAETIQKVIDLIAEDPLEASKRYGIEFAVCGVCGRGLTSDWRKVGIGPVCAKKMDLDL